MSDADVLAAINVDIFPDGQIVFLQAVFGNSVAYDDATGDVIGANICMQVSMMRRGMGILRGGKRQKSRETWDGGGGGGEVDERKGEEDIPMESRKTIP